MLTHEGYNLKLIGMRYAVDNTFAVELWTHGYAIEEPYAHVSVNLPESLEEQLLIDPTFFQCIEGSDAVAFVDANNARWLEDFLVANELAEPVIGSGTCETDERGVVVAHSNYCPYPLYHFNLDKFYEIYDPLTEED